MKLITKDTDYAVRALCLMSRGKEGIVSVSALVEKLKIPQPFLRKIFYALSKRDIVRSYKGQGGGFRLAVSPDRIFLLDIIKIFQGPFKLNRCIFNKKVCRQKKSCILREKIETIETAVASELKSVSIKSLIGRGLNTEVGL